MARRLIPLVLVSLSLLAGCNRSKIPPLNPVKGSVTRGGTPVQNVMLKLSSEKESQGFTISGISDSSGNIEFSTLEAKTNLKKSGVPEGEYTVTVIVPMDDKQQGGSTFTLPQKFRVTTGDNLLSPIDLAKYRGSP